MHTNHLLKYSVLFFICLGSILFLLKGCENRVLDYTLSKEIDAMDNNMTIAAVPLIDSDTGKAKLYRHNQTILAEEGKKIFQKPYNDNLFINMSAITVVRVILATDEKTGEKYQFCNLVKIDGQTTLICKSTQNHEAIVHDQSYPIMPKEIALRLAALNKEINTLGFLILPSFNEKPTKLFINGHDGFFAKKVNFNDSPLPIEKILHTKTFSYHIGQYNPCRQVIDNGDGTYTVIYRKDINC